MCDIYRERFLPFQIPFVIYVLDAFVVDDWRLEIGHWTLDHVTANRVLELMVGIKQRRQFIQSKRWQIE